MVKVALVQLNVTDDPASNLEQSLGYIKSAAEAGATFVLTPEMTNCLSSSRAHQAAIYRAESEDVTLAALRSAAKNHGIWLLIGSLSLATQDADGRFANRSFMIGPDGEIKARYDKIHMFDVTVSETEAYKESSGYRPGSEAVLVETDFAKIGMAVCYDVRFPHLFRRLAKAGANILTVPAAFNDTTGAAHWHVLLRARAIETGCFVLAPAQTGYHQEAHGKGRRTYGHSLIVAPWGEVLADGGVEPGVTYADLDLSLVEKARGRVPSLTHDREITGP